MKKSTHQTMLRFYLRIIVIPLLMFTAALLLIRAQPYDDHGLRQLLLPDGCAQPCFMGIRPGVTTLDEAVKLLAESKWIDIDPSKVSINKNGIPFLLKWNGNQPSIIDTTEASTMTFQNTTPRVVSQISFRLINEISLGDLYLILGKPSRYSKPTLMAPNIGPSAFIMLAYQRYDEDQINLLTISSCPLSLSEFLRRPVASIEYDAALQTDFPTSTLKEMLRYPNCG